MEEFDENESNNTGGKHEESEEEDSSIDEAMVFLDIEQQK